MLRTVLAAVANAEAQPASQAPATTTSRGIAGAADGLHAAEVDWRELNEDEVRAIVIEEREERLRAAAHLGERGIDEAAEALRREAGLLERYLDDT